MRRLNVLFLIIFLASAVYAQNKPAEKTDAKTETKTEKNDTINDTKSDGKVEKIPDGYGNLTWGMYISDARDKITGVLSYTDDKKIIVSKDRELEYYYGFFYKEPSAEKETVKKEEKADSGDKKTEPAQEKDEGKLFYVSLTFPYIDKDKVYEKIKAKYGNHTGENIKDNQGAIAWDSENTVIIMWVDRYEKKPFCRKIIYISKKMSKELNEYNNTIFNKTEIELLKKMNP